MIGQRYNPPGAYGFRITGCEIHHASRLIPVPGNWPLIRLAYRPRDQQVARPAGEVSIGRDEATIWLADGARIEVERTRRRVDFILADKPSRELIVHPLLGAPAAIMSRWLDRLSFHGGAFIRGPGAWAVLGPRAAGKSTLLAQLLERGHPVLSDDVIVVDGRNVYAGPRSIDLREESALRLGGEEMGILGNRARWRLRPPTAPARSDLHGFVELAWDDVARVDRLTAAERVDLLRDSLIYPSAGAGHQLLDLLALPAWRFSRPRDLGVSDAALRELLAQLEL